MTSAADAGREGPEQAEPSAAWRRHPPPRSASIEPAPDPATRHPALSSQERQARARAVSGAGCARSPRFRFASRLG
eukprot:3855830-Prymnesium_polylepis.1